MDSEEKLLSAIFNVGRMIREKMHQSNCLADFSHTEVEILKFIFHKKNTTMKSIAVHLHIKPSSTTPVIEGMVKKGSLKRVQKRGDRRVVYVELTAKGLKSLQKKFKNIHKTIKNIFGKLRNKDKRTLIEIFEKIHDKNI